MSKTEWERGTIIIPAHAWATFRRGLIEVWNTDQRRIFALALDMRTEVESAAKGKRGFDRVAWLYERMNAREWGSNGESARSHDCAEVIRLLGLGAGTFDNARIRVDGKAVPLAKTRAPKQKDLHIMQVSQGGTMYFDQATITLSNDTHSVTWDVSENNHARETARSMPIARAMFAALGRIHTWTRGSGGEIIGNDEYNRDSQENGGGGNYVTAKYGPGAQKQPTKLIGYGTY